MYRKITASADPVLAYEITDKLSRDEMQQLIGEIELAIAKAGKIRMLLDLKSFPYGDFGAFWEDMRFDFRNGKQIERLAVIGDHGAQKWSIRLFDKLFPTECRFFPRSDADQARNWLKIKV